MDVFGKAFQVEIRTSLHQRLFPQILTTLCVHLHHNCILQDFVLRMIICNILLFYINYIIV